MTNSWMRCCALALGCVLAAACSADETRTVGADVDLASSTGGAGADVTTTDPAPTLLAAPTSASVKESRDLGRIVVLAEEALLADVLALGVEPVASSATVPDMGFQGVEAFDTGAIETLGMTTLSLERLAALKPDTVITLEFWVDQIGHEVLGGMAARTIAIPDDLSARDRLTLLAEALDRQVEADALLARMDVAVAAGREALEGGECTVTVAAIYPGPAVAAFVEPVWEIPRSIVDLGCTLEPGPDEAGPDRFGRAYLSLEQIGLLRGEPLILFQTDTVAGERDAIVDIAENPLWNQLPAVVAGDVVEFDRLGYPGVAGQIRFIDEIVQVLAD